MNDPSGAATTSISQSPIKIGIVANSTITGVTNHSLLLGKLEAYSVLQTTYSWMRGYLFNSKNFTTLQEARTDQCTVEQ